MIDEGFVFRDAEGRKCWYIYGDVLKDVVEGRDSIDNDLATGQLPTADTEEGVFHIVATGAIQYTFHGFRTENLCGHRCHYRLRVYLGAPVRPTFVSKKEYLINEKD